MFMKYVKVYSITEIEDGRDLPEVMESVRRCIEEHGKEYGIRGVSVEAASKTTQEEYER